MKKLSLALIAILLATVVIVPAVPKAQAADETTVQMVVSPTNPCGWSVLPYPVTQPNVVADEVCTYHGSNSSIQRVVARVSPCDVFKPETCKKSTIRVTPWVQPQDVQRYSGQLTTTVALGVMDNNPLYQICMANILFFGAQAKGFDGGMSEQAMIPLCATLGLAGSVYAACEVAWTINNQLNAWAAIASERGHVLLATVYRSWAVAWGAAAGVICTMPS